MTLADGIGSFLIIFFLLIFWSLFNYREISKPEVDYDKLEKDKNIAKLYLIAIFLTLPTVLVISQLFSNMKGALTLSAFIVLSIKLPWRDLFDDQKN